MQVHANFLKHIAFGHIKDLCNHADCHYSLDCFSMTKSNFFLLNLDLIFLTLTNGLQSIYHIFQSVIKLYFQRVLC